MRRAGVVALALVLLAGALVWVLPWATEDRDPISGVPSPRALERVDGVDIAPGETACSPDLGLDSRTTQVRLQTVRRPGPRPPLELVLRGPGYTARAVSPQAASEDRSVVAVVPYPGRDVLVELCVRNLGDDATATLAASADRTRSRSITSLEGRSTDMSVWVTFAERGERSFADRGSDVLSRMATFRPGFVVPGLLGLLAVLVAAGVPLAVGWAWWRSLGDQDR